MDSIRVFLVVSVVGAAVASVYDLRSGRIPNWLSLGMLAVAPVAHFVWAASAAGVHAGLSELGWSLAGAVVCAAIPWLCWRTGSFGGGDVKLLAAVGAMCLPRIGMTVEFYSMIVGAVFALGRLAWNGALFRTLANSALLVVNPLLPKHRRRKLPVEAMTAMRFAPAVLGAVIVCTLLVPR